MSLDVRIGRIEKNPERDEQAYQRLVQSQEVDLKRGFDELSDGIEADSGQDWLEASEESSSVFNSENDKPLSRSS